MSVILRSMLFFLKMATLVWAETLEELQQKKPLQPGNI